MDYIKAAPEDAAEMYDYIYSRAAAFEDKDLRNICVKQLTDNKEKLMYYPAAQKNHHAEMAGLLYHVKRMLMMAERACEVYTNLNRELVMTGVILHDMEKINEIDSNELGISTGYSFEGKMLGHLVQGVRTIDRLAAELDIPREKAVMLEHMILSHHYEPEFGSPKKPLFPEAEMLHYLDMVDAKMFDMQEAVEKTEPGCFQRQSVDSRQQNDLQGHRMMLVGRYGMLEREKQGSIVEIIFITVKWVYRSHFETRDGGFYSSRELAGSSRAGRNYVVRSELNYPSTYIWEQFSIKEFERPCRQPRTG